MLIISETLKAVPYLFYFQDSTVETVNLHAVPSSAKGTTNVISFWIEYHFTFLGNVHTTYMNLYLFE